ALLHPDRMRLRLLHRLRLRTLQLLAAISFLDQTRFQAAQRLRIPALSIIVVISVHHHLKFLARLSSSAPRISSMLALRHLRAAYMPLVLALRSGSLLLAAT